MIHATLFKNIPLHAKFVERYQGGNALIYYKSSAGKAILLEIQGSNEMLRRIHNVGEIRRISHNNAFSLLSAITMETPEKITEQI